MTVLPTSARWPFSAQIAASSMLDSKCALPKYTVVVEPRASKASTRSPYTRRANSISENFDSKGNVRCSSHKYKGSSSASAAWGHCGACTWISTKPGRPKRPSPSSTSMPRLRYASRRSDLHGSSPVTTRTMTPSPSTSISASSKYSNSPYTGAWKNEP